MLYGCEEWANTHLQSFAKSMRKYMKSYLPQLDSSTIRFSIAWSTLFGIFRNMIYLCELPQINNCRGETYSSSDVNAVSDSVDIDMVVMTGVIEVWSPIDPHSGVTARVKSMTPVRLHVSRAGEVAVHSHRRIRGGGIEQRRHHRHGSRNRSHWCHVGNTLAACRSLVKHESTRCGGLETMVDNRIHSVLLRSTKPGRRLIESARRMKPTWPLGVL
jgi:hypothetical protein